jgi:hypothetical protein
MYILLVAPPGVGKFVISSIRELWSETKNPTNGQGIFKVAPSSVTKASLMDRLAAAKRQAPLESGDPTIFHSLLVAAEELGVLMPGYDLEFIAALNDIYNCPPWYDESRRASAIKELKIDNPHLNLLAGTQPGWLGSVFPEEAWSSGLA